MIEYLMLALLFLAPIIWLKVMKRKTWNQTRKELLPKAKKPKEEILGVIKLTILLFAGFVLLSLILTFLGLNDLEKINYFVDEEIQKGAISFAITIGSTLFLEEFFFRVFLQKRLGVIITTIIFTVLHIGYGSIAEIIGVFVLGLILAYWFKKHNSLIQNYLGHVTYDILAIVLYLAF